MKFQAAEKNSQSGIPILESGVAFHIPAGYSCKAPIFYSAFVRHSLQSKHPIVALYYNPEGVVCD